VVAGPGDEMDAGVAGRGRMRASHADREQAIEVLKAAFVQDRLTKDELDARVGQTFASRTYAELAAVTADIPAGHAAAESAVEPAARPAGTPARTLAKAALRAGICMLIALALVGVVALSNTESMLPLAFFPGIAAVIAASGFLGYGVVDAWQQRRSSRQLPPRPDRDGRGLEGGWPGSTGQDPALPGTDPDQTGTNMRTHNSPLAWPHSSRPSARAPRGIRPVPDAV
jgi:Domain of unknown function (DUF1707)